MKSNRPRSDFRERAIGICLLLGMLPVWLLGSLTHTGLLFHSHDEADHHLHRSAMTSETTHAFDAWHDQQHGTDEAAANLLDEADYPSGLIVKFSELPSAQRRDGHNPTSVEIKPLGPSSPGSSLTSYADFDFARVRAPSIRGPSWGDRSRHKSILLKNHVILI
jgi:hypothetical protein